MTRAAFKFGILYEKIVRLKALADQLGPQVVGEDKCRPNPRITEAFELIGSISKLAASIGTEFYEED